MLSEIERLNDDLEHIHGVISWLEEMIERKEEEDE